MQIEDLLKNLNPQNLQQAMGQMQKILTPAQMKQIEATIRQGNMGELGKKLSGLSAADLEQELRNNPALYNQLRSNPEVMNKINRILKEK